MAELLGFEAMTAADAPQVGGKGASLGRMTGAGLPVPPGFVVTADSYRRLHRSGIRSDVLFADAIRAAYRRLGSGPVAVRSSATKEDGADASFAGQQETILGVVGDDAVLDAIERCWASLHTERAIAYRKQQKIADDGLAMAVVVQALVDAEVAGVLFTRNPADPSGQQMLAEASWGLGEAVVSGRVTPDRYTIDHATGALIHQHPGHKTVRITAHGEEPVEAAQQQAICLNPTQLSMLAELGREVERFDGGPRDIEWAWAGGRFHLLQSRPITTGTAADRTLARSQTIDRLGRLADPRGTVWVRYNLSEVLPEPTPMTWHVVQRLLAADGGCGAMNRDLGAEPDPTLGSLSAFDLVAGRPMCNLSRLPRIQFAHPPFEFPFATFKADPRKALDPKPVPNPLQGGLRGLFRLPGTIMRASRIASTSAGLVAPFAEEFRTKLAPAFVARCQAALAEEWSTLSSEVILDRFRTWVDATLVEFARHSLKPTVLADLSWQKLAAILTPAVGEVRAAQLLGEVAVGARPDRESDVAGGVQAFSEGQLDRATFLKRFGHRAQNEMELAQPRWADDASAVDRLLTRRGTSTHTAVDAMATWNRVADEAKLTSTARTQAAEWVKHLHTYLGLRETAKHTLLMGYALIRRALVVLDGKHGLDGGIFFLVPEELPELVHGSDMSARIGERKKRRQAELSLEVPPVLFSDDLEAIGRAVPPPPGVALLEGVGLSAGSAEAVALVLTEPNVVPPSEPYILVCPSTDPAWVPLFVGAKGLVMETGGVLSHGAIVAREFGLPAVAGLPDVTRRIRTGSRLRIDGVRGTVALLDPPE